MKLLEIADALDGHVFSEDNFLLLSSLLKIYIHQSGMINSCHDSGLALGGLLRPSPSGLWFSSARQLGARINQPSSILSQKLGVALWYNSLLLQCGLWVFYNDYMLPPLQPLKVVYTILFLV